jgi:hypothetical protein
MRTSQAAMSIKLRIPLHTSSFLLLTCAFLGACTQRQPPPFVPYGGEGFAPPTAYQPAAIGGAPANYTSSLHQTNLVARQNIPISDEQAASQRPGTIQSRQTASSETVIKKGKIKKQTSTTEEVLETDTSKIVDTFSVPTSDQDAR